MERFILIYYLTELCQMLTPKDFYEIAQKCLSAMLLNLLFTMFELDSCQGTGDVTRMRLKATILY